MGLPIEGSISPLFCHFFKAWDVFFNSSVYISGEGNGTPLQYSYLGNPMEGGAWWATVHGVTKSQTQLSDFTFTFHFHALVKKWQPTPVFLPGESQGQRSLVGFGLRGRTESDTTDVTYQQQQQLHLLSPKFLMQFSI